MEACLIIIIYFHDLSINYVNCVIVGNFIMFYLFIYLCK